MNRENQIRRSFHTLLQDQLIMPGDPFNNVLQVSDGKSDGGQNLYVLIEDQTASSINDMRTRRWNSTITISIVHKQLDSYTRDYVDDVSEQIEAILMPGKADQFVTTGLDGYQITSGRLQDVMYADFQLGKSETLCIKYLIFNFITTKL